jgi:hypothetical protein
MSLALPRRSPGRVDGGALAGEPHARSTDDNLLTHHVTLAW